MKNKEPGTPTLHDVMDRYSPIVNGHTGLLGAFLKVVSRAVEYAPKLRAAPTAVPMPDIIFSSSNLAGQTLMTSNIMLAKTFRRMEDILQKSFSKASKPDSSLNDRQKFVTLAQQVQSDAAILATACLISKPEGESRYQFVLQPNPGQQIPLAQAFAAVEKQYHSGCNNEVELIRLGTDRPVILMRPIRGFKAASKKT